MKKVSFQTTRPGSWTASVVSIPRASGRIERVTAVSLYGLLDEKSDAYVHRSLSEMARSSTIAAITSSFSSEGTSTPGRAGTLTPNLGTSLAIGRYFRGSRPTA